MKATYCNKCKKMTKYKIVNDVKMYDNIYDIYYIGKKCLCFDCGEEVHSNEIDFLNMQKAQEAYNNKTISVCEIENLLNKYSIGATVLSNILGWGEVTITRYLKGGKPLVKYSNLLTELLNDPYKMYGLILSNKENMKPIAFEKALKSVNKEIEKLASNELSISNEISDADIDSCIKMDKLNNLNGVYDIELITNYILSIKELTPKALQKILYYSQGFYKAFNNLWIFNNVPQAWQHGPVYNNIYQTYKKFGFNPIVINSNLVKYENSINKSDRDFLNYVVKHYGCYTGDTLEETSHNESPWINARRGLSYNEASKKEISMNDITEYFTTIKDKYKMIDYSDVRNYIIDKVFTIV